MKSWWPWADFTWAGLGSRRDHRPQMLDAFSDRCAPFGERRTRDIPLAAAPPPSAGGRMSSRWCNLFLKSTSETRLFGEHHSKSGPRRALLRPPFPKGAARRKTRSLGLPLGASSFGMTQHNDLRGKQLLHSLPAGLRRRRRSPTWPCCHLEETAALFFFLISPAPPISWAPDFNKKSRWGGPLCEYEMEGAGALKA